MQMYGENQSCQSHGQQNEVLINAEATSHLELDSGAVGQACASVARLQGQYVKPVPP